MAIKCYFITADLRKIQMKMLAHLRGASVKNTKKTGRGLRKKEGMQKYNFYFNYPNSSKYSHRLFS